MDPNTSHTHLEAGLQMVGRSYLNVQEWTGKFAQIQNQHEYPLSQNSQSQFSKAFKNQLLKFKFNVKQCILCMNEKPTNQFFGISKCSHQYCYNCLNTYAISRIEEKSAVVCPQQDCGQTLSLTSQIYKYLPASMKLQFLKNKQKLKASSLEDRCERCLQPKHLGQCKYQLNPGHIEKAFKLRQCPNCQTQSQMTTGKKKVSCLSCKSEFCYICGKEWKTQNNSKHQCSDSTQIDQLEAQLSENKCLSCINCCECSCGSFDCNCSCQCCAKCDLDFCCELLFWCECKDLDLCCVLWNVLSIPVRLVLISLVLVFMLFLYVNLLCIIFFWLLISIIAGFALVTCQLISEVENYALKAIMILFFPLVGIAATILVLKESYQEVLSPFSEANSCVCTTIAAICVQMSPKNCVD